MFLVLSSADIELRRKFYERLGFYFSKEQHGAGPAHFTTVIEELPMEIYPTNRDAIEVFIGVYVDDPEATKADLLENFGGGEFLSTSPPSRTATVILRDPGGLTVKLFKGPPPSR